MDSKAQVSEHVRAGRTNALGGSQLPGGPHFQPRPTGLELPATAAVAEGADSSVGAYYPWLDVLRGISWILVMFGHTIFGIRYLASMGVGIFFAISGWLITKIILKQRESGGPLTAFYTRRCLRIIPLYYVLIGGACLVSYFLPGWRNHFSFLPKLAPDYELIPFLSTFSSEYWRGGGGGSLVGHCWSLCVEERFYVFWPLILTLVPNRIASRRWLIVFAVATWYLTLRWLSLEDVTVGLSCVPFPLLFGCALAIFFPNIRAVASKWVTIPLGTALFFGYVAYAAYKEPLGGITLCAYSLPAGLLAVGLVACAVTTRVGPERLPFRLTQLAGKASYAAYLFHLPFAFLSIKIALRLGHIYLAPFIGVALCGPFALALHRWFEQPILNRRKTVERSAGLRYFCAALQVIPILVGLVWLFPWHGLVSKVTSMPRQLIAYATIGAVLAWLIGTQFDRLRRAAALLANGGWLRRIPVET